MEFAEAVRNTREQIVRILNTSGLPIDAMDLLIGEIKTIVHAQAENDYMQLMQKRQQEEKKEEKKEE